MKDKEKQIEEMANIIYKTDCAGEACEYVSSCIEKRIPFSRINTQLFINTKQAEKLYEQGYRKLPEDSIVLSREEYKRLLDNAIRVDLAYLERQLKQANKETAEKFYKKVRKLLKKVDIIVDGDEGLVGYEESAVDKGLTDLAKQFGVEIKE